MFHYNAAISGVPDIRFISTVADPFASSEDEMPLRRAQMMGVSPALDKNGN